MIIAVIYINMFFYNVFNLSHNLYVTLGAAHKLRKHLKLPNLGYIWLRKDTSKPNKRWCLLYGNFLISSPPQMPVYNNIIEKRLRDRRRTPQCTKFKIPHFAVKKQTKIKHPCFDCYLQCFFVF